MCKWFRRFYFMTEWILATTYFPIFDMFPTPPLIHRVNKSQEDVKKSVNLGQYISSGYFSILSQDIVVY